MGTPFYMNSLNPLKKKKTLGKMGIIDIETNRWADPEELELLSEQQIKTKWHDAPLIPFLLCYYDEQNSLYFDGKNCIKDFLKQHLTHKNRNRIIFSHNGGKFDMIAIYHALVNDKQLTKKFFAKPVMQGSRIMVLTIYTMNKKDSWSFRDSYSLLPRSLDYLSKSFKTTHTKTKMPTRPYNEAKIEWINYCINDCMSLHDILKDFNTEIQNLGGSVETTIAKTALSSFRVKYQQFPFYTYFQYNDLFRKAYYGGRSEVIKLIAPEEEGPFYYYDINSMYPAVMADNIFPVSIPTSVRYKDPDECKDKCGIMECEIHAPKNLLHIPILPYHSEKPKKLIFPLGTWKGLYEFSFIEKALNYGYEITPLRTWEFEGKKIFNDFIHDYYNLRLQSTGAKKEILKLLLNSCYGKFAEKPVRQIMVTDPTASIEGLCQIDDVFGYLTKKITRNAPHHLPCISIRITALAQLKLYNLIESIQKREGTVYYMDTDSIMTNIKLPISTDLGDIKLEYDWKRGVFLSQKSYIIEPFEGPPKVVMKGFTELRKKLNTYEQWERLLYTKDFSDCIEHTVRPASINEIRIRHLSGFVTLHQRRQMNCITDKRIVNADYSTSPIFLRC